MRLMNCVAAAGLVGATTAMVRADLMVLFAAADNTLYESPDGTSSNGSGGYMFAGATAAGVLRRGLIRFDLTALPAGAQVESVELTLHMSRTPALGLPVGLHRVAAAWGEGESIALGEGGAGAISKPNDATWIHTFYDTQFWNRAGGDFDDVASATTIVGGEGFYTWNSAAMLAEAQLWQASPLLNHGWLVRGVEDLLATAKRFDTRENENIDFRPTLAIQYTVVPTPGSIGLALLAGVGAGVRALRPSRRR